MENKQLTTGETHACYAVGEDHLHTYSHVLPGAQVIARPHCAESLGASEERTSQHKWSLGWV